MLSLIILIHSRERRLTFFSSFALHTYCVFASRFNKTLWVTFFFYCREISSSFYATCRGAHALCTRIQWIYYSPIEPPHRQTTLSLSLGFFHSFFFSLSVFPMMHTDYPSETVLRYTYNIKRGKGRMNSLMHSRNIDVFDKNIFMLAQSVGLVNSFFFYWFKWVTLIYLYNMKLRKVIIYVTTLISREYKIVDAIDWNL